uniref:Phosphoglycerate mutase family protein n=1 Tax=Trichuris muris TaxID=70415 RepID=A0A5S6QCU9_TRIMR
MENDSIRRVLLIRHGERIDAIDPEWFKWYGKEQCCNANFPICLPPLSDDSNTVGLDARSDPPLTVLGAHMAELIGGYTAKSGFHINTVFSSPAFRCVMTAHHLLRGYAKVLSTPVDAKIKLEPGLYEWGFEQTVFIPSFLQEEQLNKLCGYNVDTEYKPIFDLQNLDPMETYSDFQERCKMVVKGILEKYRGPPAPQMVCVTHAPCMDAFQHSKDAPVRDYKYWSRMIPLVPYLGMLLWEEIPNKGWRISPPPVESLCYSGNPIMDVESYLKGFPLNGKTE